jgi:hypothetical protein
MNKLAIESYLRNLLGQVSGAEWLLVANALWASAIPTALRWLNSKDPAFGRVAEVAAAEVGKKLSTAAASAKKPAAKKKTATKK